MGIFGNLFKSQEEIDKSKRQKLHDIYVELLRENEKRSIKLEDELPIVKANKKIESALNFFELKLIEIQREWEVAYKNSSWWNKLKYSSGPDYSEIKNRIQELEAMNLNFKMKYGKSLSKLKGHLKHQFNLRKHRIENSHDHALKILTQYKNDVLGEDDLIRKSFWVETIVLVKILSNHMDSQESLAESLIISNNC